MRFKAVRAFLKLEALSGIILCLTALSAIILNNSPLAFIYENLQHASIDIRWDHFQSITSFHFVVNEGLMTLFFLLVGLELKREFLMGTLNGVRQIILPAVSALGGMLVPALIYMLINISNPVGLKGWAIPVATDIAFALGVLLLFGKRVPLSLKLFLTALAIFDDMGAIIIIALFNTHNASLLFLFVTAGVMGFLWMLNRNRVSLLYPYLLLGFLMWFSLYKAGIHPTLAGVLLALFIPIRERASPLHRLEHALHVPVAYLVMPLFAFLNAGLSFKGLNFSDLFDSVTLGIILGLFLGKQLGVFGFSFAMIKWRLASLPENTTWKELYGLSLLCGIGFTMSLFLGTLAFKNGFNVYLDKVRLGVLTGSFLSGTVGAIMLNNAFRLKRMKF